MTNGRKVGIGLGIGGALLAAAGAALAFVFGKKKNDVELIDCDEVATSETESVTDDGIEE